MQQLDLLDRIEHTAMLAAMAERLALSLCTWLLAKQCALRSASLALHYERGRHACAPTQLELAFSEPVWLVTQLMPLLRERLSRQPLSGPVVALTLRSQTVVQQHARSATLFPDPLHAPTDFRRLLDLLSARLGAEHVMQPAALADHRPEIANRWAPLHTTASSTLSSQPALSPKSSKYAVAASSISSLSSTPSTPAITSTSNSVSTLNPFPQTHTEMPFWLLSKPLALKVQANRPHYGTPLHLLQGPERIESGWWDGLRIARDYFVAQDKNAVRYWIYRERDIDHARWFLHGFFG